ncbi:proton-conducting transporter transmembrane domain-containing protein [Candidatus Nitrospira bockiana]
MMTVALLIPVLPSVAALVIAALGARRADLGAKIGTVAVGLAGALSVWALQRVIEQGPAELVVWQSTGYGPWAFYLDRLSGVMLVLITAVSAVVHLYSRRYLQGDPGYARFYALLALMTVVLICLVTSVNLLVLFVFWQLLSWLLYLLLVYNYERRAACDAALKTFLVHRFGDLAFLAGVVLAYRAYGTLDLRELFTRASDLSLTWTLWPTDLEMTAATAVALLVFVGAMAKSAQFPLHVWLPDTMDTPTPVSALMHAGIVNAGGFLLNRLAPLYAESPVALHVIFVIGGVTAILGASMMLTQNDVKKTLGFSTMGQMGYMIMECGLGAFALAIFHLIAHGLFKATLFLGSGRGIQAVRREGRTPSHGPVPGRRFSRLTWLTGFSLTLILPLLIVLLAHNMLEVPLLEAHGSVIFLFFSWVTASQAIFSLYKLETIASWKVASAMVAVLLLLAVTYLWAGEAFSRFLYPGPGEVAGYFAAAALPGWIFDAIVVGATVLIIGVWVLLYADARGQHLVAPAWVTHLRRRLYVWLTSRLFVDLVYQRGARAIRGAGQRLLVRVGDQRRLPDAVVYGVIGIGLAAIGLAVVLDDPLRGALLMLGSLIVLPLVPFHVGVVEGAGRLSGLGSALVAILLPIIGFTAVSLMPEPFPREFQIVAQGLSAVTAAYGSLAAVAERHVARRLMYGYLAQIALVWWFLAGPDRPVASLGAYVASLASIMGGLLAVWGLVEKRVGVQRLEQLGGLAGSMPGLAVAFTLFLVAAMGLPLFGPFYPLLDLALTMPTGIPTILLVASVWMAAAWHYAQLLQELWFGQPRFRLLTWDLRLAEAPLLVLLFAAAVVATVAGAESGSVLILLSEALNG